MSLHVALPDRVRSWAYWLCTIAQAIDAKDEAALAAADAEGATVRLRDKEAGRQLPDPATNATHSQMLAASGGAPRGVWGALWNLVQRHAGTGQDIWVPGWADAGNLLQSVALPSFDA